MLIGLSGGGFADQVGGFSHESEHDLAVMVSDFMENGSGDGFSWCSSDSDSVVPDLQHHAEKILFLRHTADRDECDLASAVRSLVLSLCETDLSVDQDGPCNASCIRRSLVNLLRSCGYDAAICTSKWQGSGKVPGGEHEYIDVVNYGGSGEERMIIDVDFRGHFEIARAIDSYDAILGTLPVIYTGYWARLKQLLQVMAEAAKNSLKQNSMPVPPWRSLGYLLSKWQSNPTRKPVNGPDYATWRTIIGCKNDRCFMHLRQLKSSLHGEVEMERLLKPGKKVKVERCGRGKPFLSINF
ncbi:cruciferin (DUF506) [Wolffia australiana]